MSKLPLLQEFEKTPFLLLERRGERGSPRTSAVGVIQRFDVLNGNGRIYPKKIFEKLLGSKSMFMERVKSRAVLGHIEHPSDGLPDLRKAAVVLTDVGYVDRFPGLREDLISKGEKDPDSCVCGRFEALSTPDGKIVEALWLDEVQAGASSRAQGSVVKNEATEYPNYPKGADIVQEDIDEETLTWDIVARPSTPGAFPRRVQEALMEAQEYYRNEIILDSFSNITPTSVGGSQMNLTEIRTRLSRIKPTMENLGRVPRSSLLSRLKEVDSLLESLETSSRSLNESQQLPAADMRGELQALRDRVMTAIGEAFNEASGEARPGAVAMKVSGQGGNLGTTDPAVLNTDPYLSGLKPHQQQPGGLSGTPLPQSRVDGEKVGDQSVPGAGIKGGDSKLAPHQKDGGVEDYGTIIGDDENQPDASGQSIGKKKKKGSDGNFESITTDQAHKTEKGELGQPAMVKQDEEGDSMEVAQAGGKQWKSKGLSAGSEGSKDGDKLQGVASKTGGEASTKKATVEGVNSMAAEQESLASLNVELTTECRTLRRDNAYWKARADKAESLLTETGKKYRTERRNMAMERLIENNPNLNDDKARVVLETAKDESHMVQIAEAILGGRAKITNQKERQLSIKMESRGLYKLYIDNKPYDRKFNGDTLWEALSRMGIADQQIVEAFDKAHLKENDWQIPDEFETDGVVDTEGEEVPPIAIIPGNPGEPAQVITMQKDGEEGAMDDVGGIEGGTDIEAEGDFEFDFGGLDLEDEPADDMDFGEEDSEEDDTDAETEESDDDDEEEVEESKKDNKGKSCPIPSKDKKGKKSKFNKYLESRKPVSNKKNLTESKGNIPARRVGATLPPKGGKPTKTLPSMRESSNAPAAELSLTERVIKAKKEQAALLEQKRNAGKTTLNG